jgi:L-aminopeptidase/D-esterase-like protein
VPAHTRADGDAFVAVATGRVDATVDVVRLAAVTAVERAVRTVQ